MTGIAQISLLVIGRSPRADLENEFYRVVGSRCDIRTIGALDDVSDEQIRANGPVSDSDTLFSILPDGRSVLLSKQFVTEQLRKRVRQMRATENHINVMCCTGQFPELAQQPVVSASRVMESFVLAAAHAQTKLGVFIPKPQQVGHATERWRKNGFHAQTVPLAPDASRREIETAADRMNRNAPDLVIYDCISYRNSTRQLVNSKTNAPAIVASSATVHVVAELVGTQGDIGLD